VIAYITNNEVSHSVMKSFSRIGIKVKHIRNFDPSQQAIFYGILRGTGPAMRLMQYLKKDYWYVDNGYYDAVYMNAQKHKEMTGKYRIVKNATLETCPAEPVRKTNKKLRIMLMPPSPYTAFMHDTTPEDWKIEWQMKCDRAGHMSMVRDKTEQQPLHKALKEYDAVLAFNSLGVIEAMKEGKAVYTTHGIIRNSDMLGNEVPYYDFNEVVNFYKDKQYTLQEIQERGIACLS
jgi:hypothetical protein